MSIDHCKRCQTRLPRGDWFSNLCPTCVMAEVRRLEEAYADCARQADAAAQLPCPDCGSPIGPVDSGPVCACEHYDEHEELRRAALDGRGRP